MSDGPYDGLRTRLEEDDALAEAMSDGPSDGLLNRLEELEEEAAPEDVSVPTASVLRAGEPGREGSSRSFLEVAHLAK